MPIRSKLGFPLSGRGQGEKGVGGHDIRISFHEAIRRIAPTSVFGLTFCQGRHKLSAPVMFLAFDIDERRLAENSQSLGERLVVLTLPRLKHVGFSVQPDVPAFAGLMVRPRSFSLSGVTRPGVSNRIRKPSSRMLIAAEKSRS